MYPPDKWVCAEDSKVMDVNKSPVNGRSGESTRNPSVSMGITSTVGYLVFRVEPGFEAFPRFGS